jgi:hypothetical protein
VPEEPLNLGEIVKDPKYSSTLIVESPEEAAARRDEAAQKAKHKRTVHFVILTFALVMVFLIFLGCIFEFQTGSVDDKKWAGAIVASICTAFLGFVAGQRLD